MSSLSYSALVPLPLPPSCANLVSYVMNGRQRLRVYRQFPHLASTANSHITVLWRTIKDMLESGRLTRHHMLFIQSDGGTEFTAQPVYQFCAWLVHKGYCRAVSICCGPPRGGIVLGVHTRMSCQSVYCHGPNPSPHPSSPRLCVYLRSNCRVCQWGIPMKTSMPSSPSYQG